MAVHSTSAHQTLCALFVYPAFTSIQPHQHPIEIASVALPLRTAYFAQVQSYVLLASQGSFQLQEFALNAEHSFSIVRPAQLQRHVLCAKMATT